MLLGAALGFEGRKKKERRRSAEYLGGYNGSYPTKQCTANFPCVFLAAAGWMLVAGMKVSRRCSVHPLHLGGILVPVLLPLP